MATRELELGCTFRYQAAWPTAAVFQVEAESTDRITINRSGWTLEPDLDIHHYRDVFGNNCARLVLPAGVTTLTYAASATVPDALDDQDLDAREVPPERLPDEVLMYTLASRFCQPDVLGARAWRLFGQLPPGWSRVQAISDWVHEHLVYTTGSTVATSSSVDAYTSGVGVCRDFAHLMITMCRALNIPARYTFGYFSFLDRPLPASPMDFHAWTQVFLDGRWWDFDARHNDRCKGRVAIGSGRDAADVAMVTTYGAPWLQLMTVTARERPADCETIPADCDTIKE